MFFVTDEAYLEHLTGADHPEKPERVTVINSALEQAGLKNESNTLAPRLATVEELQLCHDLAYIKKVEEEVGNLKPHSVASLSIGDAMISPRSLYVARLAVGGVLTAVDQVFSGKASKVFCIVRPPGHHANRNQGEGFCIFNNVAIAARYAQKKYHIKRVLIADWDVHHGDGTQAIFYNDPSVFCFSTHEEGNFPHTGWSEERGEGEGIGFTMNFPIQGRRMLQNRKDTRLKVIDAFQNHLIPAMEHFQPEFVLISCGFDGHREDPLGGFDLLEEDYALLTKYVNQIADKYAKGRIVSVLEGGYNLEAIAASAVSHVKAMMSET